MIHLVHFIEVTTLIAAMCAMIVAAMTQDDEAQLRIVSLMMAFIVVSCSATAWRLLWLQ